MQPRRRTPSRCISSVTLLLHYCSTCSAHRSLTYPCRSRVPPTHNVHHTAAHRFEAVPTAQQHAQHTALLPCPTASPPHPDAALEIGQNATWPSRWVRMLEWALTPCVTLTPCVALEVGQNARMGRDGLGQVGCCPVGRGDRRGRSRSVRCSGRVARPTRRTPSQTARRTSESGS